MVLGALLRMRSVTRLGLVIRIGMTAVQQKLFDKAAAGVAGICAGTGTGTGGRLLGRVPHGAAGMTPEHRLTLIIETIRALQIGTPASVLHG